MLANQNAKLTGPDQGFLVSPLVLTRKPWERGCGGPGDVPVDKSVSRAVASMYSWGGVGQKFPNDETISEYIMAYLATKVLAIRKMKTQFTNKNTHILRTDILQKQCGRELLFIGDRKRGTEARGHEMPFPGQNADGQKKSF
jgi:hypothetical protein